MNADKYLNFLEEIKETIIEIQNSCEYETEPNPSGEGDIVVYSDENYDKCDDLLMNINLFILLCQKED